MSVKYINFDLSGANSEDYNKILTRIISTYPGYKRPLNTTYYISTTDSCEEVYNKIESAFPYGSKIIVGGHKGSFSSSNLDIADWLSENK